MYDSICKFIAAQFPEDMARWLLGKPIPLTELKPSELSLEPIRADSLIFLQSEDLILHIEFQTQPDKAIPFRMLDYRIRGYRLYPQKEMIQVVIYLRENSSELTQQTVFELSKTRHEFDVIRLWEVPTDILLQSKGLLPFAVLGQSKNRENILRQISQQIEDIPDKREKSNLAASTSILAGLVLSKDIIQRLLKEDIMKESVIYQDIEEKGKEKGRQEGEANLIIRQLDRRFGQLSTDLLTQIRGLSVENLEDLGEALLDFKSENDLTQWLSNVLKSAE
ncbi:Rpn family recombination-promoting nuclease/putative transposase [Crocosphaera sp.]|uniref:Rpn family recombination-promoting nuclease/putative transposase n=1 Tax=Crocosphaera sp. TaxID=2729996 RepID=UPI002632B347|nr:Rpn family recombination-promoting nuclease/putative transposase [Crocosphaera sp.]MDJ0581775.1 Rpn family recombination-promoting nuclease/putative transposase [Crocosphaera sp.]